MGAGIPYFGRKDREEFSQTRQDVEMSNGSFFADLILFRFAGLTRSTADGEEEDSEHSPIVHFKLSDLSERLLGVKLDKSEQVSCYGS